MSLRVKDRVAESTVTTGTGTLTLAGALAGFQGFSAVGNGNSCYACVYEVDANGSPSGAWEVFIGTWSTGGTLSRDSVHSSSNGGSAVSFGAGTKYAILVTPADLTNVRDNEQQTALGYGNTATGTQSAAIGNNATASGEFSAAFGSGPLEGITASGYGSVAVGAIQCLASENYTAALGVACTASGKYATASGVYCAASGYCATASGYKATASGHYSGAFGSNLTNAVDSTVEVGADNTHKLATTPTGLTFAGRYLPQLLSTTTGINAKTVAATTLYTVPAGKTLVVTKAVVRCTAASAISNGPTAAVKVSGGSAILASLAMNGLTATGKAATLDNDDEAFVLGNAGDAIQLDLTNAATGTSQTVAVDLIGYLV